MKLTKLTALSLIACLLASPVQAQEYNSTENQSIIRYDDAETILEELKELSSKEQNEIILKFKNQLLTEINKIENTTDDTQTYIEEITEPEKKQEKKKTNNKNNKREVKYNRSFHGRR